MTTMHAYFRLKCVLPVIFLSVLSSFQNGGRPCQFLNSKRSFVSFLFLAWLLSIIGVSAPFIYFILILWKFMTSWTMNSNMHMHIHILGVHCIHSIHISFQFGFLFLFFCHDYWMFFITSLQSFQLMEGGRPRMNPGCQRSPCCKKSEHFFTPFTPIFTGTVRVVRWMRIATRKSHSMSTWRGL